MSITIQFFDNYRIQGNSSLSNNVVLFQLEKNFLSLGRSHKNDLHITEFGIGVEDWVSRVISCNLNSNSSHVSSNSRKEYIKQILENNGLNIRKMSISKFHVFFVWIAEESSLYIGAFRDTVNPVYFISYKSGQIFLVPNGIITEAPKLQQNQKTQQLKNIITENNCFEVKDSNFILIIGNELLFFTFSRDNQQIQHKDKLFTSSYLIRDEWRYAFRSNLNPLDQIGIHDIKCSTSSQMRFNDNSDVSSEGTIPDEDFQNTLNISPIVNKNTERNELEGKPFIPNNSKDWSLHKSIIEARENKSLEKNINSEKLNESFSEQIGIVIRDNKKKTQRSSNNILEISHPLESPPFTRISKQTNNNVDPNSSNNSSFSKSSKESLQKNTKKRKREEQITTKKKSKIDLVEESPLSPEAINFSQEDISEFEPSEIVVMFTGLSDELVSFYTSCVERLGGKVASEITNIQEVTHLITDKIRRTIKFLCALSVCPHILSVNWIDNCDIENRFVSEKSFMLKDLASERQFDFHLKTTFQRRELSNLQDKRVFTGLKFYITENTVPNSSQLSEIIVCGDGIVVENLRNPKTIVIASPSDLPYLRSLGKKLRVYNVEFIFRSCLLQRCDFEINNLKL